MAKRTKKKRTKSYSGENAKSDDKPTVHRYSAVDRGKYGQWWYEKKRIVKPIALYGGGSLLFIILVILGLVSVF